MKNQMMFGLVCLAMLGGFASAYTESISDERAYAQKLYIGTAGTLRYVGPVVEGYQTSGFVPYLAGSQSAAYMTYEIYSPVRLDDAVINCPMVNGVSVCA